MVYMFLILCSNVCSTEDIIMFTPLSFAHLFQDLPPASVKNLLLDNFIVNSSGNLTLATSNISTSTLESAAKNNRSRYSIVKHDK